MNNLTEAKRYVRRYYARPMAKFASNKAEVLRILVDAYNAGQNCTIYTLINLPDDDKDVTKLTNSDIIYTFDDGVLKDANGVPVFDYNLMIKHEENRDKIDPEKASEEKFKDVYDDRITDKTGLDESIDDVDEGNSDLLPIDDDTMLDEWAKEDAEYETPIKSVEEFRETCAKVGYNGTEADYDVYLDFYHDYLDEFDQDFEEVDEYGESLTESKENICCICGEPFEGFGNNPYPVKDEGRCCDNCNAHYVIPARLADFNNTETEVKEEE